MLATRRELSAESLIGIWLLGVCVYVLVWWCVFVFTCVCRSTVISHSSHTSRVAKYALQKRHFHEHNYMHIWISPDQSAWKRTRFFFFFWLTMTIMISSQHECVTDGALVWHISQSRRRCAPARCYAICSDHRDVPQPNWLVSWCGQDRTRGMCVLNVWFRIWLPLSNRHRVHTRICRTGANSFVSCWLAPLASTDRRSHRTHRIGSSGAVRTWATVTVTRRGDAATRQHDNNNCKPQQKKPATRTCARKQGQATRVLQICVCVCCRTPIWLGCDGFIRWSRRARRSASRSMISMLLCFFSLKISILWDKYVLNTKKKTIMNHLVNALVYIVKNVRQCYYFVKLPNIVWKLYF